jgi:lipopolysaccharide assembly protein A
MRIISYIILVIIIILGVTFALLNAEPVSLNYYVGTRQISLSLLLVLFLGVGVIFGLIVTIIPILRLKNRNRQLKQQLKQMHKESAVTVANE